MKDFTDIRLEFTPEPLIDRDGQQIAAAIIADDVIRVSTAVSISRWTEAVSIALAKLGEEILASRPEALPKRQRERFAPDFEEAVRKILGDGEDSQ